MNRKSLVCGSAALLSLALGTSGRAQSPLDGPVRVTQRALSDTRSLALARPVWLEKTIDVNIKNESPAEAIRRILKSAGKTLEKVEIGEDLPDVRLSLSVRKIKVGDALAAVGRIGGAITSVADNDDRITVYLKKRVDLGGMASLTELPAIRHLFVDGARSATLPKGYQIEIEKALADARGAITVAQPRIRNLFAKLPDKRVSVDLKRVEVRDALKKILSEAGVAYSLDDDLPTDASRSFTFENVPLGTALDVVCQSANIGWRAEKADEKGGILVKVGKKYFGNGGAHGFSFTAPTLPGLSGLTDIGEG